MPPILDRSRLSWREVGAIAAGEESLVRRRQGANPRGAPPRRGAQRKNVRAYGVNTGVGALCDVIVIRRRQRELSRNIVMSHAVGVGPALGAPEMRAIIAAAINNFARGHSGVRLEVVETLPRSSTATVCRRSRRRVGRLPDAHGARRARVARRRPRACAGSASGAGTLRTSGVSPVVLEAKEGLSLVTARRARPAYGARAGAHRAAAGLGRCDRGDDFREPARPDRGVRCRSPRPAQLAGPDRRSARGCATILRAARSSTPSAGRRTQDALSLRAIPHVHGAVREHFAFAAGVVDAELASVTDNPGRRHVEAPRAFVRAHAVGAAVGLCADSLGVALAELAAMSERRIDRLVNPLVSGLPPFLAADSGAGSAL